MAGNNFAAHRYSQAGQWHLQIRHQGFQGWKHRFHFLSIHKNSHQSKIKIKPKPKTG